MPGWFSKNGVTRTLAYTVAVICIGSSTLMGYAIGELNIPGQLIRDFLRATGKDTDTLYALTNAVFVVGGAIGAFAGGFFAERFGRRNTLIVNQLLVIAGGVLAALCVHLKHSAPLYIGRFLIGLNSGITITVASMYLVEISPLQLRGSIGALHQLAVTIGIALSYGLSIIVLSETFWPLVFVPPLILAVLSLFVYPLCPESPRYLFLRKRDEDGARRAFLRLNSADNVDDYLLELREEEEVISKLPPFTFFMLFTDKNIRLAVIIACLLQVLQQASGINAVIVYSTDMLDTAGLPDEYIKFGVLGIGIFNFICTIVAVMMIKLFNRRTMLLRPTILLAICLLVLTILVTLAKQYPKGSSTGKILGFLSLFTIIVYIAAFAVGLGPMPAMTVSELFLQAPRAFAYSLSQFIQWLTNLIVLMTYPILNKAIGGLSFLPFLAAVLVMGAFMFLFLPETRDRRFEDITKDLQAWRIVPNLPCFRKKYDVSAHMEGAKVIQTNDELK